MRVADDAGLFVASDQSTGVHGTSTSNDGIVGESTADTGVAGVSTAAGSGGPLGGLFGFGSGIYGKSTSHAGVFGWSDQGRGVVGLSPVGPGVFGFGGKHAGVAGTTDASVGVFGSATGRGWGVLGTTVGQWLDDKHTFSGAGVEGDSVNTLGVVAMTQGDFALLSLTRGRTTAKTEPPNSPNGVAGAFGGDVTVDGDLIVIGVNGKVHIDGSLEVVGNKHAVVPFPDGSHRALYSVESPESWFEDFGRARLRRGKAQVRLDRAFASVVRTGDYHIFLSPEGESRGLYVSRLRRGGFEVREQQGGASNLPFSYRVVARRKDVAAPRFKRVVRPRVTPVRFAAAREITPPTPPRPLDAKRKFATGGGLPVRAGRSRRRATSRRSRG